MNFLRLLFLSASTASSQYLPNAASLPPIPIIEDCFPGPWVIFFDKDRAELDVEDRSILDYMVSQWRGCGNFSIHVNGHTDINERDIISRRRADIVKKFILGRGIPSRKILVGDKKSSEARVPNSNGVAELENRRVEIILGAQ